MIKHFNRIILTCLMLSLCLCLCSCSELDGLMGDIFKPGTSGAESADGPSVTPEESRPADSSPAACAHNYQPFVQYGEKCTDDGYLVYTCSECGDSYRGENVKGPGHSFGDWINVRPATENEMGLDRRVCTECGEEETRVTSLDEVLCPRRGNGVYGYYDLARHDNGEQMQRLYLGLLSAAEEFVMCDTDVEKQDGMHVFAYVECEDDLTMEEMVSVWKVFVFENPTYYWLSNELWIENGTLWLAVSEDYAKTAARRESDALISEMTAEADGLIEETDGQVDIALKLHDFLRHRITYARNEVTGNPETAAWAHNIDGAARGHGVCEAYARAYSYLCRLYGIEIIVVSGVSRGPHAWNYIKLDGEWYLIDVTWDDVATQSGQYKYFGLSEASMRESYTPDPPDIFGIEYLYRLPALAEADLDFELPISGGETREAA